MHYLIIGIIAIVVAFSLGVLLLKGIFYALLFGLFHPKVNSIIYLIFFLLLGVLSLQQGAVLQLLLIAIVIFDCVLDIRRSISYYICPNTLNPRVDKLYLAKSLTSLLTFGFSRIVFCLIVGPYISFGVLSDIKKKIAEGQPLPAYPPYLGLQAKRYYYSHHIRAIEKKGGLIYNGGTINSETEVIQQRLQDLYPKSLMQKLAEKFTANEESKDLRERLSQKISDGHRAYAYLRADVYERYARLIPEAMLTKTCYSPSDIKNFEELSELNLTAPVNGGTSWGEYFIIQALQPLVDNGTFMDHDISDGADIHAYQHTGSTKPMPSIDADNNPLFALDDDD